MNSGVLPGLRRIGDNVPDLAVEGIVGALNPSRYAGSTLGGSPTTGSWSKGDWVVDQTNAAVYICTASGTPGTWASAGPTASGALIGTLENVSSTSFVDLTTPGPSVTVTIRSSGLALAHWGAQGQSGGSGGFAEMGLNISGANTIAPADDHATSFGQLAGSQYITTSRHELFTGLTAGSTTFKVQYKSSAGTSVSFLRRFLVVTVY